MHLWQAWFPSFKFSSIHWNVVSTTAPDWFLLAHAFTTSASTMVNLCHCMTTSKSWVCFPKNVTCTLEGKRKEQAHSWRKKFWMKSMQCLCADQLTIWKETGAPKGCEQTKVGIRVETVGVEATQEECILTKNGCLCKQNVVSTTKYWDEFSFFSVSSMLKIRSQLKSKNAELACAEK